MSSSVASFSALSSPSSRVSAPSTRPISIKSTSVSTPSPSEVHVPSSWYLRVAVGGKPNFLFLSDNLTPAPASQIQAAMREDLTLEDPSFVPPQTPQPTRRALLSKSHPQDNFNNNNNSSHNSNTNNLNDHDDLLAHQRSPANIQEDSMNIDENVSSKKMSVAPSTPTSSLSSSSSSPASSPSHSTIPSPMSSPSRTNRYIRDSDIRLVSGNGVEGPYPSYQSSGYGQDAWFIACDESKSISGDSENRNVAVLVVGVSDGVGGWRSSGVDSGIMARAIMNNSLSCIRESISLRNQGKKPADDDYNAGDIETLICQPRELLARAYNKVKAEKQVEAGSTTACILSFVPQTLHSSSDSQTLCSATNRTPASSVAEEALFMHSCNLGDSGFVLVRNGSVCGQSEFQRDETNVVKQLAVIPPSIQASSEYYEYCDDKPHDAVCACHPMREGDILVLASDGLWDNLQSDEPQSIPFAYGLLRMRMHGQPNAAQRLKRMHERVESAVREATHPNGEVDCQMVLSRLVKYSQDYMRKPEGKPDDLTILVAQIKKNNDSTAAVTSLSSSSGTTQSA